MYYYLIKFCGGELSIFKGGEWAVGRVFGVSWMERNDVKGDDGSVRPIRRLIDGCDVQCRRLSPATRVDDVE